LKILLLSDANSIHTLKWVESLKENSFDILLFSLFMPKEDIKEKYKHLNVKIVTPDLKSKINDLRNPNLSKLLYLKSVPMIRSTIRTFEPNILHAHYASSYGILGMISRFHPFIVSVWGSDLYLFAEKNFIYKKFFKNVIKSADKVCSTSKAMKKILIDEYNQSKVYLIPFGIDTNKFKPIKYSKNLFTIGTIKSIEDHNGIDCLLDATKILVYDYKIEINVLIVGSGSKMKKMQEKSALLKIDKNVTFTGFVEHEKVIEYFNQLSIFIAVSTRESFGVAVLEAAALGIPSITSDVGGLTEVNSNNKTGIVINANNPKELADSVMSLYRNKALREKFGNNARQRVVKNFSWNNNVNKMITLYNEYF